MGLETERMLVAAIRCATNDEPRASLRVRLAQVVESHQAMPGYSVSADVATALGLAGVHDDQARAEAVAAPDGRGAVGGLGDGVAVSAEGVGHGVRVHGTEGGGQGRDATEVSRGHLAVWLDTVEVTECWDCPAFDDEYQLCQLADQRMGPAPASPPDWCPLRSGPVTLRLKGAT